MIFLLKISELTVFLEEMYFNKSLFPFLYTEYNQWIERWK